VIKTRDAQCKQLVFRHHFSSPLFITSSNGPSTRRPLIHGGVQNRLRRRHFLGYRSDYAVTGQSWAPSWRPDDYVVEKLVICGTVNKVVDQILELREDAGDFGSSSTRA
jgi:hypothetical protein